jgi:hypothetical protein
MVGTPAYAAPEQLEGREADAKSDQFSFAATAWEAIAGSPPFEAHSIAVRLAAIRKGPPPSRALLRPLRRALAFDPEARWPSMSELLEALEAETRNLGRRRRAAGVLGVVVSIGVLVAGAARVARTPVPANEVATPNDAALLDGKAQFACPVLDASGVPTPSAWLGAAAADLACRRAVWLLGGNEEKVLSPGALLDFAARPERVVGAWEREGVREESLDAARTRAGGLLDGAVRKDRDGFHVQLTLERPPGRAVGTGSGGGPLLHVAVRRAMQDLEQKRILPVATSLDPDVVRFSGVKTVQAGALLAELGPRLETEPRPAEVCASLKTHVAELGFSLIGANADCDAAEGVVRRQDVPLDRSSPEALAATAPAYFSHPNRSGRVSDARAIAVELRRYHDRESSRIGKRALATAEARLWIVAGDSDRAATVLRALLEQVPGNWDVNALLARSRSARNNPDQDKVLPHRSTAWVPESPMAWEGAANSATFACKGPLDLGCTAPKERALFQQRAVELGPSVPVYALHLALRLLDQGGIEETRALGARLLLTRQDGVASAYVLGLADAREGLFARAFERMRDELIHRVEQLNTNQGSLSLMLQTERLSHVLGKTRERELSNEIARRFVLSDRPLPAGWQTIVPLVVACMYAERNVASRAIRRIKAQRSEGGNWPGAPPGTAELVLGAERFAAGDLRGAAEAWRRFAPTHYFAIQLPPEVFDRTGAPEIASQMDAQYLRPSGPYAGIHPAFAREAKRAQARGDVALARALARRVVDAWSTADVPVPAVEEMKKLLAR